MAIVASKVKAEVDSDMAAKTTAVPVADEATAGKVDEKDNEDVASVNVDGEDGVKPAEEPTKRSLRFDIRKKILEAKVFISTELTMHHRPSFLNAEQAALMLSETEEFERAKRIKVNVEGELFGVKMQALMANKELYVAGPRDSGSIFMKFVPPQAGWNTEQVMQVLLSRDAQMHCVQIDMGMEPMIKLDMVVVSSLLVSRKGNRIGRGNTFTDIDIAIFSDLGAITSETVIATIVHDVQLVESLPSHLFKKHDVNVDLIVTPTKVVRVPRNGARKPTILWELVSPRHMRIVPLLRKFCELEIHSYEIIHLQINGKSAGNDASIECKRELIKKSSKRRRRRFRRGAKEQRSASQTDNERQPQRDGTGDGNAGSGLLRRRRRRRRSTTGPHGLSSSAAGAGSNGNGNGKGNGKANGEVSNDKVVANAGGEGRPRSRRRTHRRRGTRYFSIGLSNLTRDVRVKDLKDELRKRECKPISITWRARMGKCILHFGNRNGEPVTQEDVDKTLKSISNLTLTIAVKRAGDSANVSGAGESSGSDADTLNQATVKTVNVIVELVKFTNNRIIVGTDGADGADGAVVVADGAAVAEGAEGPADVTAGVAAPAPVGLALT